MNITFISLISIGAVAVIVALIWTKLIKPNTFAYTNKNYLTKQSYNNLLKKIKENTNIYEFNNLKLNFYNQKITIIERMFLTNQNVYIISNPIEKKATNIIKIHNEIKVHFALKNKTLDLPLDVNLLIANAKSLKRKLDIKNMKIIIPMSNEKFNDKEIDNMFFINQTNLEQKIFEFEQESSEFNSKQLLDEINKYKINTKERRRIFGFIKHKQY